LDGQREESQTEVPKSTDQPDPTFEEANLQLNDGLTSCRSVVNDYRALILGVGAPEDDPEISVEEQLESNR
jgi:hypothetical protein